MLIQTLAATWLVASMTIPAPAQRATYQPEKARRHFITINYDRQYTHALSFASHPLEDLLGTTVREVHLQSFQYQTTDQRTLVAVNDFTHRTTGVGMTVYPFGSSNGATLALRGSIERLPEIRLAFTGPAPVPVYALTGGRALDAGIGVEVSDRSPGWGLGSHTFVIGGVGRAQTDQMDGSRYFIEGGGGLTSGPFGVDVSIKFAVNRFTAPVSHRINTVPISLRGTLSF